MSSDLSQIVRLRSDIDKQDSTMLRLMTQLSSASDNQLELKGQIAELEGILASIEEAADEDFQVCCLYASMCSVIMCSHWRTKIVSYLV